MKSVVENEKISEATCKREKRQTEREFLEK
jgi:hypothetical protein